jgi:guanosine-3',5'-bis(diphosphate) 3'-pyrophosphohydrolase
MDAEAVHTAYQAYLVSERAHHGQQRQSGEPYITHPVEVSLILAKMRIDLPSILAALLHDVIEDTECTKEELSNHFGEEVAELVDGVSKLTQMKFESRAQAQAENFRKMVMAMAKDIRVIIIKLADRLHNMRTLGVMNLEKRKRIATETLDIYAPIANRLGMHAFRVEYQNLGFSILYPMRYRSLKNAVQKARGNRKSIMHDIERNLRRALKFKSIYVESITGREKHLYSIFQKMREKHISFSEIMDIYGFRVITDSPDSCYRILGTLHSLYKPIQNRFKDYIAIPKANGYQSLHTTLFGPYGVPIEMQIRTTDMEKLAERGIAAHWIYKTNETLQGDTQLRTYEWLENIVEIQNSAGTSLEFIENVKIDLFPDEVYVFTPRGNIMELPSGATPIDFAYAVHSDIGNSCVAARLDRRLAPLSTILSSGQTVEIITAPSARPNPAWLNFVVTGKAKSTIKHFLKTQRHAESIELGKRLVYQALHTLSPSHPFNTNNDITLVAESLHLKSSDDLYEQIGLGNRVPMVVAQQITLLDHNAEAADVDATSPTNQKPLSVKGTEGIVISYARCCLPIPGDHIVGLLTPDKGLIVHYGRCKKVMETLAASENQATPLQWEEHMSGNFQVNLIIELVNHKGMLADIAAAISEANSNIANIHAESYDDNHSIVDIILAVKGRDHLAHVIQKLRRINGIMHVFRNKENLS